MKTLRLEKKVSTCTYENYQILLRRFKHISKNCVMMSLFGLHKNIINAKQDECVS